MNVLWLTMDHVTFHHYRHLRGAMRLPFYESLCREGAEFTACKSAHPLCLPCRAGMLTGVYTHKHGKYRNDLLPRNPSLRTVGEYLRAAGVAAGYFGKNHSGYEDLENLGFEGFFPRHYGNPYKTPEYAEYLRKNGYSQPIYVQEWAMDKAPFAAHGAGRYDLTRDDVCNMYGCGYLDTADPVHEADFLVSLAGDWLAAHKDAPFVLRVDTWGPHHTYTVPLAFRDTVDQARIALAPSLHMDAGARPDFMRDRLQAIAEKRNLPGDDDWRFVLARAYEHYASIDSALARLRDKLAALGLLDNTAILLTADHGDSLGSCGGMFDKAGDMPEEVMEIPMALYVPGAQGGRKVDSLTSNLDVAPTVLSLCGLPVPEAMDGQSLLALLRGDISPREELMCEHYGHFLYYASSRALYHEAYKLLVTEGNPDQLYNVRSDPFETRNLANDPAFAQTLADLRARLRAQQEKYGDNNPLFQVDTRAQRAGTV